ncbi:hypothetical protein [Streptomyces sp. NPDC050504]
MSAATALACIPSILTGIETLHAPKAHPPMTAASPTTGQHADADTDRA